MRAEEAKIFYTPAPFAVERCQGTVPAGTYVDDIVASVCKHPFLAQHTHVWINGEYVPRDLWCSLRVKRGTHIAVRVVAHGGGGGKSPVSSLLSLALMVAAPGLGAALQGALGFETAGFWMGSQLVTWGRVLGGVISIVGSLAINALAGPPKPRQNAISSASTASTQFISGAQNQASQFGAIPRVMGQMRMVPLYGTQPFTESSGSDQYIRMLFVWGYGPLVISDICIGDTAITEFEDVEIETKQGFLSDTPLTLITEQTRQADLSITLNRGTAGTGLTLNMSSTDTSGTGIGPWQAGGSGFSINAAGSGYAVDDLVTIGASSNLAALVITAVNGSGGVTGITWAAGNTGGLYASDPAGTGVATSAYYDIAGYQIQTTDTETDEISLDILYPKGLVNIGSGGGYSSITSEIEIGYSPTGMNTWTTTTVSYTLQQTNAIVENFHVDVTRGQYDVRLKRLSADTASATILDEAVWSALRSIKNESPVNMPGVAMTAVRIRATDQLNGVINQLNGIVQSILPEWNGTSWDDTTDQSTWHATSNPAAIYRNILQGSANKNPLPDSRINLPALEAWHDACNASEAEFNAIMDSQRSVQDCLNDVAAVGRASPGIIDGTWTVVRDQVQTVPVQHFTQRNTWGFNGQIIFPDYPHAFRAQFLNRNNNWLPDETVVYDDGYNADGSGGLTAASMFETLQLVGITNPDHVYKDARYHIATARLRPQTYVFNADIEHIVCTRGDLVKFNHDVTLQGLGRGRIKAIYNDGTNVTSFDIDDVFTMTGGTSYSVRFRLSTGATLLESIVTNPGAQTNLVFTTPFLIANAPAVGDLVMFGIAGSESVDLVVKSIVPQGDLTAQITCLDYAPGVFTADSGPIPPYDSQITIPVDMQRPPAPVVASVQADDTVLVVNANGSWHPSIAVTLAPPNYPLPLDVSVSIQYIDETRYSPAAFTVSGNQISITNVASGGIYNVSLVYNNNAGMSSPTTVIANETVTGGTTAPDDVTGFDVNILAGTAYLSWDAVSAVDVAYYQIKYNSAASGANWANSFSLIDQVSAVHTSIAVQALPGTYLIKAVNAAGIESIDPTLIVSTITAIAGLTSILTLTESPNFYGPATNCTISAGALALTDTTVDGAGAGTPSGIYYFDVSDFMDDWIDVDLVGNWDTYVEETDDLGAVYTATITASVTAIGIDSSSHVDDWMDVDDVQSWDQSVAPSSWGIDLQIRTTSGNPKSSPTWTAWQRFVTGEYTCRAYQFRLILYSYAALITPSVSALSVTINMPNRTDAQNNLIANAGDSGGTAVTFVKSFNATPSIQPVGQSMSTGDYWQITNQSASGFNIAFFNSSASRITKTFDYSATGYGQGA